MAFPQKNYTFGRYRVYFDPFLPGTKTKTGQRYLGNTPELNMTSESENLDHFDADNGIRIKDDSMLLELNRTGSFITDHISPENLALFFLGDASVLTQASATAQTYTIENAKLGRRYQIGASALAPAGVRGLDNVSVTGTAAGALTAGTDYTVNLENGGIVLLDGGNPLIEDDELTVTFDVEAVSYNRIVTADNSEMYGALFLESRNPKGERMDYYIPYASIRPDGDFALKGDEWQQLPFSFEILKLDDATPHVLINGLPGSGI